MGYLIFTIKWSYPVLAPSSSNWNDTKQGQYGKFYNNIDTRIQLKYTLNIISFFKFMKKLGLTKIKAHLCNQCSRPALFILCRCCWCCRCVVGMSQKKETVQGARGWLTGNGWGWINYFNVDVLLSIYNVLKKW